MFLLLRYEDSTDLARLVVAFLVVVFLLLVAVFFAVAVRAVVLLVALVAFFVFARDVVFFTAVRPLVDGASEASPVCSLVVAFLRVPRRVVAPSCWGFSSALRCAAMTS